MKQQRAYAVDGSEFFINYQESNDLVGDFTAAWANSAGANTVVVVDVPLPAAGQAESRYLVTVINPSPVTALAVVLGNKETIGGIDYYPDITSLTVGAGASVSFVVQGFLLGSGGRITLSNNTALGVAQGFTALLRIRKI